MPTSPNNGLRSVSVFLDLRKAFDVIKHDVLLTKLESYGVKESELRWFNSYLSESSQYTLFENKNIAFPAQAAIKYRSN